MSDGGVLLIVAWAMSTIGGLTLPMGSDTIADPLQRYGRRWRLRAEPWASGDQAVLVALGLALLGTGLHFVDELAGAVVACASAALAPLAVIDGRLRHHATEIELDDEALALRVPRALSMRTVQIQLRDIRSVEVMTGNASSEQDGRDYVCRYLRIILADGSRRRVPLPMKDDPGDAFVDELRARIEQASPVGDRSLVELVEALAKPTNASLYRGELHGVAIDPDRRGFVRERGAGRVAVRVEREGAGIAVRFRVSPANARRAAALERVAEDVRIEQPGDEIVAVVRRGGRPTIADVQRVLATIDHGSLTNEIGRSTEATAGGTQDSEESARGLQHVRGDAVSNTGGESGAQPLGEPASRR